MAESVLDTFARIPRGADESAVEALVGRGRGLLAHGLGRLTSTASATPLASPTTTPPPDHRTATPAPTVHEQAEATVLTAPANPGQFEAWNTIVVYDNWAQPDSRALTSKDALCLVHRGSSAPLKQQKALADPAIYQGFLVAGHGGGGRI